MTVYSILIIGCGLVTWLPRILPFVLIRKLQFPAFLLRFLSYVPACILTALLMQSIFIKKEGHFPDANYDAIFAAIPTIIIAIITRNLMWEVSIGMISIAILRHYFL